VATKLCTDGDFIVFELESVKAFSIICRTFDLGPILQL
jgi:hypothetical protein